MVNQNILILSMAFVLLKKMRIFIFGREKQIDDLLDRLEQTLSCCDRNLGMENPLW